MSVRWTEILAGLQGWAQTNLWGGLVDVATIVLAIAVVRLSYRAFQRDRASLSSEPISVRHVNGLWVFRVRVVNYGLRDACLKPIDLGKLHGKAWGAATTHIFCGNKENYDTDWDRAKLEAARSGASKQPYTPMIQAGFREDITIVCQPVPGVSEYLEVLVVPYAGSGTTQNLVPSQLGP